MTETVTISKQAYDTLKREAGAWRRAVGTAKDSTIFNAARDNHGKGIDAGVLAAKLRRLAK